MAGAPRRGAWLVVCPDYTVRVSPVHGAGSEEHDMDETTEDIYLFGDATGRGAITG